jgi:hypothetical protein
MMLFDISILQVIFTKVLFKKYICAYVHSIRLELLNSLIKYS